MDDYEKAAYTSHAISSIVDSMNAREKIGRRKGMDRQGDPVEGYKKKDGVPILEKQLQKTIKQMMTFKAARGIIEQRLDAKEQDLATMGQRLLRMLPSEPTRDLDGMNFPGKEQPDYKIRY